MVKLAMIIIAIRYLMIVIYIVISSPYIVGPNMDKHKTDKTYPDPDFHCPK